jgi:hypothetical protein
MDPWWQSRVPQFEAQCGAQFEAQFEEGCILIFIPRLASPILIKITADARGARLASG